MKVELLDSGILAKGLLSKKEIPYDAISVAFLRIEEVQAKVCCGKANFDRSFLVLVTNGKEEVIEMGLFGDTKPNEFVSKFIGDYVGIATDGYMLKKEEDPFSHKAHHAGSTLDELIISIIGVN